MSERTQINHFIPCHCSRGALGVTGIEVEDLEGHIYIYNIHTSGTEFVSRWQRIKDAWSILRGRHIMGDDASLGFDGVTKLRDACQDALDRWPDPYMKEFGTLDEIYQSMQDEDVGRSLRLSEENK